MIRLERILWILVLTGFVARDGVSVAPDQNSSDKDDQAGIKQMDRGLRSRTQHGFLDGRFPAQRYRNIPSSTVYYRIGGKGGISSKSKSKSKSGKGGKGGGYNPYDDDIHGDDFVDDDDGGVVNGLNGYDISYCLPIPHSGSGSSSSSSSSSNSWDFHKVRNRQLRGNDRALRSKSKSYWGGRGKGKGKGKGSGYRGYGPQDYRYYNNGFGYGFEYGPDGLLRPRCPPGYVYFDQLPAADRPNRPSRMDQDRPDRPDGPSSPTQTPISSGPTEPGATTPGPATPGPDGPATPGPDGPATPAPDTAATPGPQDTPAPDTPADTPAPDTPADTPAPDTPSETPAPDTPADTPAPDTPADTQAPSPAVADTPAPDTPADTQAPSPAVADTQAPTPAGVAGDSLRVVVEDSYLEYGFFAGTTLREPTQEELDGLVVQTNLFFTMVFMEKYGADFSSFSAEDSAFTFNPDADYPVTIDFTAAAMFAEGATPPSRDEIFSTMQNSDLNMFIQEYVWDSAPVMESLFYDVQRVRYDARITNVIGKNHGDS